MIDEAGDAAAAEDEAALAAEAGLDAAENDLIAMASTVRKGWTISYRKSTPESRSFTGWRARWARARARYTKAGIRLVSARTRPACEETLAKQERWAAKRRKKAA